MSMRTAMAVLAAGLLAGPAGGDVVHLTNGEVFEDVVAAIEDDRVRLRLPFGELDLPREGVERIERRDDGLRAYLKGRALLDRARPADAGAWLELALEARADGLDYGYREALEVAADLEPTLPGLAREMHRLGWVLDRETERWRPRPPRLSPAPAPAAPPRQVPHRQTEVRVRFVPREQPPPGRDEDEVERALARTLETLAQAELARARREARPTTVMVPAPLPVVPVLAIAVGGWVSDRVLPPDAGARPAPPRVPGSLLGAGGRVPGSLLAPVARRPGSLR